MSHLLLLLLLFMFHIECSVAHALEIVQVPQRRVIVARMGTRLQEDGHDLPKIDIGVALRKHGCRVIDKGIGRQFRGGKFFCETFEALVLQRPERSFNVFERKIGSGRWYGEGGERVGIGIPFRWWHYSFGNRRLFLAANERRKVFCLQSQWIIVAVAVYHLLGECIGRSILGRSAASRQRRKIFRGQT